MRGYGVDNLQMQNKSVNSTTQHSKLEESVMGNRD
jgi:hypothetical protein